MPETPEMPFVNLGRICSTRMTISSKSILESLSKNGSKVYLGEGEAPRDSYFFNEWLFRVCDRLKFFGTEQWAAICNWLLFHGIDPMDIPADSSVFRDPDEHYIQFAKISRNDTGFPVQDTSGKIIIDLTKEQGEAGPLPWPEEMGEFD